MLSCHTMAAPWINPTLKQNMLQALGSFAEAGTVVATPRIDFVNAGGSVLLSLPLAANTFQNSDLDIVRNNLTVSPGAVAAASGKAARWHLFNRDEAEVVAFPIDSAQTAVQQLVQGVSYMLSILSIRMTDSGALSAFAFLVPLSNQ